MLSASRLYQCHHCGHTSSDAFISLFSNETFCSCCGRKHLRDSGRELRKRGRPKTINKKQIRSIRFDDDEWSLIQAAAVQRGQNISSFIRTNLRSVANDVLKDT